MLERPEAVHAIRAALKRARVVALLGPRQCGKTTLARTFLPASSPQYFDLENPKRLKLLEDSMLALEPLRGLVVIDEVQRRPELFPVLRVLADRVPLPAKFLILGSASTELLQQSSESLAGRLATIELSGFTGAEVGLPQTDKLWQRGGFPSSFLARTEAESVLWREDFIRTFAERDVAQFGGRLSSAAVLRFWAMVAHYHGQVWNAAEPARSLGVSEPTVRRYLDLLSGLFMVRQLQPWHENLAKRQVKSPKVYVRDSGVFHQLMGIRSASDLLQHPKCGASWEGFVLEQVLAVAGTRDAYFWATHQGAELDLLLLKDGRRYGVEIKRQDAARMTPSIRTALEDLKLEHVTVVYPGPHPYAIADKVSAVPLSSLITDGVDALWPKPKRIRKKS